MFQESQKRRIDLKEDDPSTVETMIKYLYTLGYDATAQSEISPLGLHARIYTIADKYEVLALKSIALERFRRDVAALCKDGKAMVEATHALDACRPFPICDPSLHDLMVEAWLLGGKCLLANIGESETSSLLSEVAWLSVALANRMLKSSKSDSLPVSLTKLLTGAERLDQRKKAIYYVRYRLQKAFVFPGQAPKEEDMPAMSELFSQLEKYDDLQPEIIKNTKIHKVLKAITLLDSIPKNEEFGFKWRSAKLLEIWGKCIWDKCVGGSEVADSTASVQV